MNLEQQRRDIAEQDINLAEQRVLGAMLIDPRCVSEVLQQVEPEDFSCLKDREVFLGIRSLARMGRVIDMVTVFDYLRQSGVPDASYYSTYLCHLADVTPTSAGVAQDIQHMKARQQQDTT